MAEIFLTLEGVTVQWGGVKLLEGLDWTVRHGEQWAVIGPSGSGKTVLAHTLMGRHFSSGRVDLSNEQGGTRGGSRGAGPSRIAMVEQQHLFRGRPGATDLYYQQRFNAADADKTITVEEELAAAGMAGHTNKEWLDSLHVRALLEKPLIQLSNGENKRVQLAIALLERPDLLILDNPFLGLDTEGRAVLHTIINRLATADHRGSGNSRLHYPYRAIGQGKVDLQGSGGRLSPGSGTGEYPPAGCRYPGQAARGIPGWRWKRG